MNLYPIGKAVTYPVVRFLFKMSYEGLENIPADQGFILASNHRSNFDPLFIAHMVPQQLRFMAKVELFKNKLLGWLLTSLGAFPVERGSGDSTPMETAAQIIRDGGVLTMFPEGHRSKDGRPLRARSGIGMLAAQTEADVLPCAIQYGPRLGFRCSVTVRYGKLIHHNELHIDAESPRTIRVASKQVMDHIVTLLDPLEEA